MTETPEKRDVKFAAKRIGVSVATVYALIAAKQLAFIDVGTGEKRVAIRFLDADLDAFLNSRRVAAAAKVEDAERGRQVKAEFDRQDAIKKRNPITIGGGGMFR